MLHVTEKKMMQQCFFTCLLCISFSAIRGLSNDNMLDTQEIMLNQTQTRHSRWFPFYTLGRFQNTPCAGSNKLLGTCVLGGECRASGGIVTGPCSSITRQAVCCVYQQTCGATTSENNTYFVNPNYPSLWDGGGQACSLVIKPYNDDVCQLRIDLLDLTLAPPNGDGICKTDFISIVGGASKIPNLCGENSGQHIIVNFAGRSSITISVRSTASYIFGRHWHIRAQQIYCNSEFRAPSGCLQYYYTRTGIIRSFNYSPSPNSQINSVGVEGSRQLANLYYGICIRTQSACSITYSVLASDIYSFTLTGDVGAVDPVLLGTGTLQQQMCTTDYIIIPNPSQAGSALASGNDRFCGLGLNSTTSNARPFIIYSVTDADEAMDIGNRGFALSYSQNLCPLVDS